VTDNQATHLYATVQGSYVSALLAGETWQFGVRFCTRPGLTAPPALGSFVPFGVVAHNTSRVESDWTINGNWTTEMGASDLDVGDWLNDQVAPAAVTMLTSSNFSSQVRLDAIKAYPIRTPDGHAQPAIPYATGSPMALEFTGTHPVGAGSGALPPQVSAVASLRTSQVGRRGRGRCFLPALPVGYLASGTLDGSAASGIATAFATFLGSCALNGTGPGGVWVQPVVTGGTYTDYSVVDLVRVSTILDTQRRRRKSLVGTNHDVTPTYP
jgi:hypothetical protein